MDFVELLNRVPLASLMLVVALGFMLGRIRLAGVSFGPAPGTLGVALALGFAGVTVEQLYGTASPSLSLGAFGFALFIYSVGFEAGPGLFAGGVQTGRFLLVGALTVTLALGLTCLLAWWLDLGSSAAAGVLAGALTSAPTFAAAREVCSDPTLLAVTFALVYPLGLLGTVLMIQVLPRLTHEDLAEGTRDEEPERDDNEPKGPELRRVFEVRNPELVGCSLADLDLRNRTGCVVTRVHRGSSFAVPTRELTLEMEDHLMVRGRLENLTKFSVLVGPEVYDHELRYRVPSPRAVHVDSAAVIGKSLRELSLVQEFACVITEVHRRDIVLEPKPDLVLQRDDVVLVSGARTDVRKLARKLGRFERSSSETDISVYAGGILLGLLLGELRLSLGGVTLELGSAVGLLVVGVLLGRFRRVGRLSAHVPRAARYLVRDLGILLFVAETGLAAGGGSWSSAGPIFWETVGAGLLVALLPAALTLVVARRVLRLHAAEAWGAVGGGMTSSAALVAIRNATDSNEPAASYAAAYAAGSVLATLAGRIVVLSLG